MDKFQLSNLVIVICSLYCGLMVGRLCWGNSSSIWERFGMICLGLVAAWIIQLLIKTNPNYASQSLHHRNGLHEHSAQTHTVILHQQRTTKWKRPTIREWRRGDALGRGSFGLVYEGFAAAGFFFAVKEIKFSSVGSRTKVEEEIALLSKLNHENIVQYYGTERGDSVLYIFLELLSKGSLYNLYKKFPLQGSQVSAFTRQILHGLRYLHENKVIHRDIKCANILIDGSGTVKLADFGLARVTESGGLVKSFKGTLLWMAPEVINDAKRVGGYGVQADIWSLGCTVLEMLTGKFPYADLVAETFSEESFIIMIGNGRLLPTIPNNLSADARDFIRQCLKIDPSSRPTAAQLLDHPFVKEV